MKSSFRKVWVLTAVVFVFHGFSASAQDCSSNSANFNFFTSCGLGSAPLTRSSLSIEIKNGDTMHINGDLTVTGTLTITFVGGDSNLQIDNGFTLQAQTVSISGSNSAGKNLIVNGTFKVIGNLAFDSGQPIEIDGSGSISAGSITGADQVTCTSTGGCPVIQTPSCGDGSTNGNGSGFCDTALPIELAYFNAALLPAGSVSLTWKTFSELNFDYFSVERSSNGKEFSELAQVKGQGTTKEAHAYALDDFNPRIGKNYYRLTSVDFDGYSESFKVVSVNYSGERNISVVPNPTGGRRVNFKGNFDVEGDASVTIFDNVGGVVGTYALKDDFSVTFQNELKSGIYFAKFNAGDFTKVTRFVVHE